MARSKIVKVRDTNKRKGKKRTPLVDNDEDLKEREFCGWEYVNISLEEKIRKVKTMQEEINACLNQNQQSPSTQRCLFKKRALERHSRLIA